MLIILFLLFPLMNYSCIYIYAFIYLINLHYYIIMYDILYIIYIYYIL
jgi:hypothetical protein